MDPRNSYTQKTYIENFNVQIFDKGIYQVELNGKLGTKTLTFKKEGSLVQSVFLNTLCHLNFSNETLAYETHCLLITFSRECRESGMMLNKEKITFNDVKHSKSKDLFARINSIISKSQPEFTTIIPELIKWSETFSSNI